MKAFAQVLLILFFVVLFFVGLVAGTFKFQLLDYTFWTNNFQKNNVYQNLSLISKTSLESQIGKEGGNKNDISILTDLITPENTKDIVNKNLQNILTFASGKSSQIVVYLPEKIIGKKAEMPLSQVLTKYNYQELSHLAEFANYFFAGSIILLVLILIAFIFLTEKGKRFFGLGIALLLSGGLIFSLVSVLTDLTTVISKELVNKPSIIYVVSGTMFPPVIIDILSIWRILSLIAILIGLTLFFIKKPRYNKSK